MHRGGDAVFSEEGGVVMKLEDKDLEELAGRTDHPWTRLDEHDRCCEYCAVRMPERCGRAKVLLRAIELSEEGMSARRHGK